MTPEDAQQLATSWARDAGHTLTPEALATVAGRIATALDRDAGGFAYREHEFNETFRAEGGQAVDVPVGEFVAGLIRKHGTPIAAPVPETTTPAAGKYPVSAAPWVRFSPGPLADAEIARAAAHDAAMVVQTKTYPNPWRPGQVNLTRQAQLNKFNPALAAQYKAEVGI